MGEVVFHAARDVKDKEDIEGILIAAEVIELDGIAIVLDDQIFWFEVENEAFIVACEEVEADLGDATFEGNVVLCLGNQTK